MRLHNSSGLGSWALDGLFIGLREVRVYGTGRELYSATYQLLRTGVDEAVLVRRLNLYVVEAVAT
jgi:hypothetical protein